MPVLRRLIKVSAVVLGVGLVLAGCSSSPVKAGSAAIVGNQRITIATLDTEVTNLNQAVKQYPGTVQLNSQQEIQETLAWLVRFQIFEQMARQAGITVSSAQAQTAVEQIYASAKASAQQQGVSTVTLDLILAANGIPPNLSGELGRYQAIETQFVEQVNGGQIPTSSAAQTATATKLEHAQCVAAKTLNPVINPQFGQLSYGPSQSGSLSQFQVMSKPNPVAAPEGPATPTPSAGLPAAC
jgi:outer membrane murein-binding lipoprotein Lpp